MAANSASTSGVRFLTVVTAVNVLVASGFSIAGLIRPDLILPAACQPTEASSLFAMYAAARTLPLAVITIVVIYKRSTGALLILGLLAGVIQFSDALVGEYQHDIGKTVGPLILAVLQFWSLAGMMKSAQTKT
jgi:hypothetical protein